MVKIAWPLGVLGGPRKSQGLGVLGGPGSHGKALEVIGTHGGVLGRHRDTWGGPRNPRSC